MMEANSKIVRPRGFGAVPDVTANALPVGPAQPATNKLRLPPIESGTALLAADIPKPKDLVPLLIHQGAKVVIGGGSKSYKTWLLTHLALCVANGLPWLGFETTKGRVLYINLEIQRYFFRERLAEISKVTGGGVAGIDVWNLRGYAADISLLITEILEMVGNKYDMIIVDPIYKVLGARDENAAGDISGLLNELEKLAVQSGAAVVYGAHFSKGNQAGKESIDRIGGSGVYGRDPDTILTMTRHEEDDAFTVEPTLRNHPPVASFVVRWRFPTMQRDASLNPSKLKQVKGRQKLHDAAQLLEVLGDAEMTYGAWLEAAKEGAGMGVSTFKTLRSELVNSGRVFYSKLDQTYQQAEKAKKAG